MFAEVGSNVVGFNTKNFPAKAFRLAAIQFENTTEGANLNELVPYTSDVSIDDDYEKLAPHIQVQKANGSYDYYYYVKDAWYGCDEDDNDLFKPGWADSNGVLATPELKKSGDAVADGEVTAGASVWFKDQGADSDPDMQTKGAVIADDVDIDVPEVFRLRAGGHPIDFNLNDATKVVFSGMPVAYANSDDPDYETKAAHIQVQKANGSYEYYYYVQDAWYGCDEDDNDLFKPGWCDSNGVLATPELKESGDAVADGMVLANAAFWARGTTGQFHIKFLNPIAK